jgi:uncharacterized protein
MVAYTYPAMPESSPSRWEPVRADERYQVLDLLRGFALFGVLMINLLYFFRISLFDHILRFHSHAGWANHVADVLATGFLEFKAFNIFAFTFGIGIAVQSERASLRGVNAEIFLLRRFLILMAMGVFHMVFISNVDILTLYSVCGLVLLCVIRLPAIPLLIAGLAAIYLPTLLPLGPSLPSEAALRVWANDATRIYSHGTFREILLFRWQETRALILPLLAESAQNTVGMMLLGLAAWRSGVIRTPNRFRIQLWVFCAVAGSVGVVNTVAELLPGISGYSIHVPFFVHVLGSYVPLALAYVAFLLILCDESRDQAWLAAIASAGRMALSNYLTQSIAFSLIFYGFGAGLFGQIAPAPAAAFGIVFYAAQLGFSVWWLRRYYFGPFEWIWRSLTYGRQQPMRRFSQSVATV